MNIAGFNEARLRALYETFGEPATVGGLPCAVCPSAHKNQSGAVLGGIDQEYDRTIRVRIADLSQEPKAGWSVVIGSRHYQIATVTSHMSEYILGLIKK